MFAKPNPVKRPQMDEESKQTKPISKLGAPSTLSMNISPPPIIDKTEKPVMQDYIPKPYDNDFDNIFYNGQGEIIHRIETIITHFNTFKNDPKAVQIQKVSKSLSARYSNKQWIDVSL